MDDTFPSLEVYVNVGYGEDGRRIIALPPHYEVEGARTAGGSTRLCMH